VGVRSNDDAGTYCAERCGQARVIGAKRRGGNLWNNKATSRVAEGGFATRSMGSGVMVIARMTRARAREGEQTGRLKRRDQEKMRGNKKLGGWRVGLMRARGMCVMLALFQM